MIVPVILSGGSGSRLWPLSRAAYPKQFISLVEENSLLGSTLERLKGIDNVRAPIVIANADHRFEVAAELHSCGLLEESQIILEPVRRNTAPAIAVAAHQALALDDDAQILVLPADHVIKKSQNFYSSVAIGTKAAAAGSLVTFGIVPDSPHTGYGYIHCRKFDDTGWGAIERFVEKPSLEVAEGYLASKEYLWNSGMFLFRAQDYLNELHAHNAEMVEMSKAALESSVVDLDFIRLDAETFAKCPSDSIDYAVMEKTAKAVVVPLDADWSDVGSWSSLWEIGSKDEQGNVCRGDAVVDNCSDCYIHSTGRLVATLGIENQVIVETSDAVLVADKSRVEEVKGIVNRLQAESRAEYEVHKKVYRPWGAIEEMVAESRFQVNRITVNPGKRLSMQMHHHRAEHWVVVKGTALICRGEDELMLSEDQSTYIPLGTMHYISNPGLIPLEIIEVQTGSYLSDDDVIRFDQDTRKQK